MIKPCGTPEYGDNGWEKEDVSILETSIFWSDIAAPLLALAATSLVVIGLGGVGDAGGFKSGYCTKNN